MVMLVLLLQILYNQLTIDIFLETRYNIELIIRKACFDPGTARIKWLAFTGHVFLFCFIDLMFMSVYI